MKLALATVVVAVVVAAAAVVVAREVSFQEQQMMTPVMKIQLVTSTASYWANSILPHEG